MSAWRRLHDAHALVLDAPARSGWRTRSRRFRRHSWSRPTIRTWYANCGWDAFGIGAALHVDSTIETECADCHEPIRIDVRDGRPTREDLVFHVLVPAASWWDDIGYT